MTNSTSKPMKETIVCIYNSQGRPFPLMKFKRPQAFQLSTQLPETSGDNCSMSSDKKSVKKKSSSKQLRTETSLNVNFIGNLQIQIDQPMQRVNMECKQVRTSTSFKQSYIDIGHSPRNRATSFNGSSFRNLTYAVSVPTEYNSHSKSRIPLRKDFNIESIPQRDYQETMDQQQSSKCSIRMQSPLALKQDCSNEQVKDSNQILCHQLLTYNGVIKPQSLVNHQGQECNDQILRNLSESKISTSITDKTACLSDLNSNLQSQISSEENEEESQDESQDTILNEQSQDQEYERLRHIEPENKNLTHNFVKYSRKTENQLYQHFDNYMTRYTTTGNLDNNWQSKPQIRKFKYASHNLAFSPCRESNPFYGMTFQQRADLIIQYFKMLQGQGVDFIFIQQWGHYIMQQKLLKALKSKYLNFYYPKNLVQHEPFSTIILSRRKVMFGQFRFDINCQWDSIKPQVYTANAFCQLQVQINNKKQTFMFMSNHSRARRGEHHFKDERKKQHDAIWQFSQSYHHSFIAGDWNVGTQKDYQNEKLNKYDNMVDFAYLQCAGKRNKEKTYIKVNNEGRTFTEDRLDRVFCISDQYKNKSQMKKQIIGTVTSHDEIPEINKGYKKMQFLLNTKFSMHITLSDHSFINGQFGLKSKK